MPVLYVVFFTHTTSGIWLFSSIFSSWFLFFLLPVKMIKRETFWCHRLSRPAFLAHELCTMTNRKIYYRSRKSIHCEWLFGKKTFKWIISIHFIISCLSINLSWFIFHECWLFLYSGKTVLTVFVLKCRLSFIFIEWIQKTQCSRMDKQSLYTA